MYSDYFFYFARSLETIDSSVFEGCANLASINLEKVKYINQKAFKGCEC
ncbi:MAG: leucine-rich repeat protein [Christensenellaceae bacterium]